MEPITFHLPKGAEISNYIYPDYDLDDLTQDMLTVRLPNGFYIDVGWYPEHDPKGRFVIRVFREFWDRQQLAPLETRDLSALITRVEDLAERFSRPQIALSRTGRVAKMSLTASAE